VRLTCVLIKLMMMMRRQTDKKRRRKHYHVLGGENDTSPSYEQMNTKRFLKFKIYYSNINRPN